MIAPKHTPPELEVDGLYVIAVRGSTRQQVADCSVSAYGNSYVKLFGASQKMREALHELLQESVVLSAEYLETFRDWPDDKSIQGWEKGRWKRALVASENARAALAAAEGRTEEKEG